jgi:hypothetical protein
MLNYSAATAISAVTSFCMSALRLGEAAAVGVRGRGTIMSTSGIHTPAFPKVAVSGVRAWSPPV